MANFRGKIIQNLLRLLTPEEISELTTSSCGAERVELNNLISFELAGNDYRNYKSHQNQLEEEQKNSQIKHSAKIIEINNKDNVNNNQAPDSFPKISAEIQSILDQFILKCKEMEKNPLGKKRLPKRNRKGLKKQMSTFILEEKEKMDSSFSKLKSCEILDLYQKNASVDIDLQRNSEDFSNSSQSGILVNKKRA